MEIGIWRGCGEAGQQIMVYKTAECDNMFDKQDGHNKLYKHYRSYAYEWGEHSDNILCQPGSILHIALSWPVTDSSQDLPMLTSLFIVIVKMSTEPRPKLCLPLTAPPLMLYS